MMHATSGFSISEHCVFFSQKKTAKNTNENNFIFVFSGFNDGDIATTYE